MPKMLGSSIVEMMVSTYMSKEFQEVRGLNQIIIVVTVSRHKFLQQFLENDLSKMDVSSHVWPGKCLEALFHAEPKSGSSVVVSFDAIEFFVFG